MVLSMDLFYHLIKNFHNAFISAGSKGIHLPRWLVDNEALPSKEMFGNFKTG